MGGVCCSPESVLHKNVTHLPNEVPNGEHYFMKESPSIRFSDVSVNREQRIKKNQYKFVMKVLNSDTANDQIVVSVVILNEKMHCLLADNYQLKIYKRMIIDIFSKKLQSTFVEAKNQRSGVQLSIRVLSFRGYTSQAFKKGLYNIYILNKIAQIKLNQLYYHRCIDYFVYGCNPDRQALTILYQRAQTSLANVAEFRKLAQWPWTTQQKLKIFLDILESVYFLHKKKICHRDIRPSNILFVQRLGKYVIGNFSKSIQIAEDFQSLSNRTVYGIQFMFKKSKQPDVKKISNYIRQDKQYASYIPRNMDYNGLQSILNILESCDILQTQPQYQEKIMKSVNEQLANLYLTSFEEVRQNIIKIASKYDIQHLKLSEDQEICLRVSRLASVSHKETIQNYLFQTYDILGYQKQFSDTTHYLIQKNNQNNKSLENAYLLKNLGQFFQRNGAKGTQYYCNSCLLFLKRAQRNLDFGNLQKAQQDYYQAEKTYIKFSQNFESHSSFIQLHRIKALISLQEGNLDRALSTIRETFKYAANKKISIQKQMTLLLSYAKIQKKGNDKQKQMAEQKLKNGLAICQNTGAFQNISSCRIHTSNFLYQLGALYLQKLKVALRQKQIQVSKYESGTIIHSTLQIVNEDSSNNSKQGIIKLKAMSQSNLNSCLEIREKQPIQTIMIAQTLFKLGQLYFLIHSYSQSKKILTRCEIILKETEDQINTIIMIKTLYLYGGALYQLKQYNEAERKYKKAYQLFSRLDRADYQLLKFNILGNLGLSQLQLSKSQGDKNILEAKNQIKRLKGDTFYDYLFLNFKHREIRSKGQRKKKTL